jgi:hypothetical protein
MSVPENMRETIKLKLWKIADEIRWRGLSVIEKSKYYERWTRDSSIGGMLAHYMDHRQVRMYIKDSIMRRYSQTSLNDHRQAFRLLNIPENIGIKESFNSPKGKLLIDGRLICWGQAKDWKIILLALYERCYYYKSLKPFAVVLFRSSGKYNEQTTRDMINSISNKLGIEKLLWADYS